MRLTAPPQRTRATADTARRLAQTASKKPHQGHTTYPVHTRDLGRFVGQAVPMQRAVRPAKRRLLHMQQSMAHGTRRGGWNGLTFLSIDALHALRWWNTRRNVDAVNGDQIRPLPRPMQVTVAADAKASDSRDIASFGGWLEVRIDGWDSPSPDNKGVLFQGRGEKPRKLAGAEGPATYETGTVTKGSTKEKMGTGTCQSPPRQHASGKTRQRECFEKPVALAIGRRNLRRRGAAESDVLDVTHSGDRAGGGRFRK